MKKIVLAVIACLMVSGVAMAESPGDFETRQQKMIGKITSKLEVFKDDATKTEFLTNKRSCVEAATDAAGLEECFIKFPPPAVPADAVKKAE